MLLFLAVGFKISASFLSSHWEIYMKQFFFNHFTFAFNFRDITLSNSDTIMIFGFVSLKKKIKPILVFAILIKFYFQSSDLYWLVSIEFRSAIWKYKIKKICPDRQIVNTEIFFKFQNYFSRKLLFKKIKLLFKVFTVNPWGWTILFKTIFLGRYSTCLYPYLQQH